ncbi:hypothetical protein ACOMHN_008203 [Nucella lapillus]
MNSNVVAVRWHDNRTRNLLSSYTGIEPQSEVNRWDKAESQMPGNECNKFMGGVDLLDALKALYKYPIKSRRWYMYIFFHTTCITVVNAWLWYRRHCTLLKVKAMKLSDFQTQVSDALIQVKRPVGRPSAASPPLPIPGRAIQRAPVSDVPYDGADHLPEWAPRDRCKSLSFVRCIKCNVFLCLNKETASWHLTRNRHFGPQTDICIKYELFHECLVYHN